MTTDELRAVRGLLGVPESAIDFENMSAECSRDLWRIVNAEHRADDDVLIDAEWLRSIGATEAWRHRLIVRGDNGCSVERRTEVWIVNSQGVPSAQYRTRGQFRALCKCLGIMLKEGPTK